MEKLEIIALADGLLGLGSKRNIYNFLKSEGANVQSYSNFSKNFREGFYDSYREDMVYKYIPDEDDQRRIWDKLK